MGEFIWPPSGESGTVTSVGLSAPSIFSVSGSPVTTSGTLGFSFNTQAANLVLAGPSSGGPATPTFRALVAADIPDLSGLYLKLDQTTPQIVTNGVPLFNFGLTANAFGYLSADLSQSKLYSAYHAFVDKSVDWYDCQLFAPNSGAPGSPDLVLDWRQQIMYSAAQDAWSFEQTSTPAFNPSAGFNKIYPKSDDNWYSLNSAGVETPLGGGSSGPIEEPKVTIGDGDSLIIPNTSGVFWIAPFSGNITQWRIWTGDNAAATCEVDVKINGTTIGQNIDLSAASSNSGTGLSIAFVTGDKISFNVDANTSATKIVVQLVAED